METGLRISVRRNGASYEGVLRLGRTRVVWACGHYHQNRDQDQFLMGRFYADSAYTCARKMCQLVEKELGQ